MLPIERLETFCDIENMLIKRFLLYLFLAVIRTPKSFFYCIEITEIYFYVLRAHTRTIILSIWMPQGLYIFCTIKIRLTFRSYSTATSVSGILILQSFRIKYIEHRRRSFKINTNVES
uniref:Uncharacterized protein n=1 Tax=Pararge aegeria TaxID=116150 RepID=S4NTE0_9NEOP